MAAAGAEGHLMEKTDMGTMPQVQQVLSDARVLCCRQDPCPGET